MVQTDRHLLYAYCPRRQSCHGPPIPCTMPQRPRAIALTSRSAVRTVGVSPCEGIRCAIPAQVAAGRHRNSTLSGEGIALHHCWASCPRDPSVPFGEKHPVGRCNPSERRTVYTPHRYWCPRCRGHVEPARPCASVGYLLVAAPPHPLLSKANHLTDHFPTKQGRKCLVDLFQRDLTRDHLIEFQLAVQIHINVAWHVDTKTVRAHTRPLNLFLLQEVWTVQLDLGTYRNHTDHRGRATFCQHIEGLLRGLFEADGFEGVFDPTPRQIFDLLHRITFRSIHEVCGTADLCEFQLARTCVNGDDAAGPGDGSPLDSTEPDPAATNHGPRTPWGDFCGVYDRPDTRGHATANERSFIKGHILADLHHGVLVHQELFSIGGEI